MNATSLDGKRLSITHAEEEFIESYRRQTGLPELVCRLLIHYNISAGNAESFLNPSLKNDFPDPFSMTDMRKGATEIANALIHNQTIGLFGDFDVDGATSTAVLTRFLRSCGQSDIPLHIPHRLTEGYGPNIEAFESLKQKGCSHIIITDCGSGSVDIISKAQNLGLKCIILDHHEVEKDHQAPATALINPKRNDDQSGLDMMAAVGVAFVFTIAVRSILRERGYFAEKAVTEPPLIDLLDIVALGTIADMMPLIGVNRLFVKRGLIEMAKSSHPGMKALLEVSNVTKAPSPRDCGFGLGPRINAGGRIHDPTLGSYLLSTDDPVEAMRIAKTLDHCNTERRQMEKDMVDQAVGQIAAKDLTQTGLIFAANRDWHAGLSGLVAGRLKEKFGKPAVCVTFAKTENGTLEARGSGRSIPGVSMARLFISAVEAGLVVKGGGHAMAGGFTAIPEKLSELESFLSAETLRMINEDPYIEEMHIASEVSISGLGTESLNTIDRMLGPFGQGHSEPLFLLRNVIISHYRPVGANGNHISFTMQDKTGQSLRGIAFSAVGKPLGTVLKKSYDSPQGQTIDLIGALSLNEWNGRTTIQFEAKNAVQKNFNENNKEGVDFRKQMPL